MVIIATRSIGALLLAAIAVCLPAGAEAQVEFTHMGASGRDIRKTVIADGIYQFMTMRDSYVRQLNSIVIVNDKDVLVFDTNTRPSSARLILAEIRKITDKPVRYVVNSHGHPDHWSGNEVYADAFLGLEIIATEQTEQLMRKMADVWPVRFSDELKARQAAFAKEVAAGKGEDGALLTPEQQRQDQSDLLDYETFVDESKKLRRVFPTVTFTDKLTLFHGGREFHFMSVTGDAEGTTVLYLPKEKVLITGDAVSYPMPYVSSKPGRQAEGLRMLSQLDADIILPGHGPAFHDKAFLRLELQLLDAVISGVAKAGREGIRTLDEIQKAVTVDELREQLVHGDSDLEVRFRSRVKDLVGFVVAEGVNGK